MASRAGKKNCCTRAETGKEYNSVDETKLKVEVGSGTSGRPYRVHVVLSLRHPSPPRLATSRRHLRAERALHNAGEYPS